MKEMYSLFEELDTRKRKYSNSKNNFSCPSCGNKFRSKPSHCKKCGHEFNIKKK